MYKFSRAVRYKIFASVLIQKSEYIKIKRININCLNFNNLVSLNIYLIFNIFSFITPLQVVARDLKFFETMVILNFKIKETLIFVRSENIFRFFYVKYSGFVHLNFLVLSKKSFLRQASGIVCLTRVGLSIFSMLKMSLKMSEEIAMCFF